MLCEQKISFVYRHWNFNVALALASGRRTRSYVMWHCIRHITAQRYYGMLRGLITELCTKAVGRPLACEEFLDLTTLVATYCSIIINKKTNHIFLSLNFEISRLWRFSRLGRLSESRNRRYWSILQSLLMNNMSRNCTRKPFRLNENSYCSYNHIIFNVCEIEYIKRK